MRYGKPSIKAKLKQYKKNNIEEIIVIPLYPQYSSTTTASVYYAVVTQLMQWRHIPNLRFISYYHKNPLYIETIAKSVEQTWEKNCQSQLLLLSFHGLPEQLTQWSDPYFKQCHRSAALIAEKLSLSDKQ